MQRLLKTLGSMFLLLVAFTLIGGGINPDYAEAKSKMGGKSFKMSPSYKSTPKSTPSTSSTRQSSGSFSRGLMGGLLGGALGGMLFGSMFGAGGSGMGILPLLILAGIAYFLFKKMRSPQGQGGGQSYRQSPSSGGNVQDLFGGGSQDRMQPPPPPPTPDIGSNLLEDGLEQIRSNDRKFDPDYFKEVASDVFFQVQAGWMRRDLDSYRHLLGDQLAAEYADHFEKMRAEGKINKLESIAVRTVELTEAGSDGQEDFVTVKFTASLLDYTVDDKTGDVLEGSNTTPIKFQEQWTWARSVGTEDWKLEGIKE